MPLLIAFAGQGAQHRKMFDVLGGDTFGKPWLKEASDIIHIDLLDESAVEKACADVILVQCLIVIQSVGTLCPSGNPGVNYRKNTDTFYSLTNKESDNAQRQCYPYHP